jgi:hypothetical protein
MQKRKPIFDNIYSGSLCEKIHLKFCKFILGVHKRTTNIAVLSLFFNFPSVFFRRRLISVFVVLSMFTMILIDPYHDGFIERYNSLVSLYASFNSGCKNNFGLEKYLTIFNNFELRRSFAKLHTSSHRLQIELDRYQGVPRHNRMCTKCSSNVIEDELHFLFD